MKKYLSIIVIIFLLGISFWYATIPEEEFDGERYVTLSQASEEDCLVSEKYDSQSQSCYIICNDLEDCRTLEDSLFTEAYGALNFPDRPTDWEQSLSDENLIARYTIDGKDLTDPTFGETASNDPNLSDEVIHQELWDQARRIIPNRYLELYLDEIVIFSDGIDETLAYVEPINDSLEDWSLGIDPVDSDNSRVFEATLVHELAHLISLNSRQIDPDGRSCHPTYEVSEGCVLISSYLARFFDRFWIPIYDEWLDIDALEDEEKYYSELDTFYLEYQDQFVSDYAVTNPEEDFAESFMVYILGQPQGLTEDQREKVKFFSQFQEFVELKREIRATITS